MIVEGILLSLTIMLIFSGLLLGYHTGRELGQKRGYRRGFEEGVDFARNLRRQNAPEPGSL